MNAREFRLDFFIAIGALLVSAASALALIYQTRVVADQYAATVWPYLDISTSYGRQGEKLVVNNDGMGPAIVRSARLFIDGKPISGWDGFFDTILREPDINAYFRHVTAKIKAGQVFKGSITTASFGPGETIRPGDAVTLLDIEVPNAPIRALEKHRISLALCYCSINKSCWMLQAIQQSFAGSEPQPVSQCGAATAIMAPTQLTYPSAPQHRK